MNTKKKRRLVIAVLSETSLIRFLWSAWRGDDLVLLQVFPHLRQLKGVFDRVGRWLIASGRVTDARSRYAAAERVLRMPKYSCLSDMYLTIEPWVNETFRFDAWDRSGSPYAGGAKETAWVESERQCNIAHVFDFLTKEEDIADAYFIGISPEMAGLCRAYSGQVPPGARERPLLALRWLANGTILVALLLFTMAWTVRHTRFGAIQRRHYLFGATLALDPRLFRNIDDIVGDRSKTAIIYTVESEAEHARAHLDSKGIAFHSTRNGLMNPGQALVWGGLALRDLLAIGLRTIGQRPMVFLGTTKLGYYRLAYRAFFNRFRFDYVLGRDDHDQIHHMRSQELRRLGGVSLGINHGIPVTDILEPGWRYIDFDHYYVFGRALYERHYKTTWPAHMKVTAIGTFGLSRHELQNIAVPRSKDIMIFANPTLDNDRLVDTAIALAKAFPDRHVFFKTKPAPKDHFFVDALAQRPTPPPNFKFVNKGIEATYELMMRCGYSISTISTVGAETVHVGARTFILDTQPPNYPFYYREFDGLTFRQPEEVIERIRAMESGATTYPWDAYDGLADASGQDPFDRIRADIGLPPVSPYGHIPALKETRAHPIDPTDTI